MVFAPPLFGQDTFTYFSRLKTAIGANSLSPIAKPVEDGYITIGVAADTQEYYYMEKVDELGQTVWTIVIAYFEGLGAIETGREAIVTDNQDIVWVYDKDIGDGNRHDIYVVRINKDGEEIWRQRYINPGQELPKQIIATADGNFMLVSYQQYEGERPIAYILKVNAEGKRLWAKSYNYPVGDILSYKIQETPDLGYILGCARYDPVTDYDMYLLKIDYWGNKEWDQTYGSIGSDCTATVKVKDKGTHFTYLISGCIKVEEVDQYGRDRWRTRMYQAEVDMVGDIIWEKIYTEFWPHTNTQTDLRFNHQGFILVADYNQGSTHPILIQFDPFGHVLWSKRFITDSSATTYIKDLEPTLDGRGYVMAGYQFSPLPQKSWVLTIDSLGNTCAGLNCDSTVVIPPTDVVGWSMPTPAELQLQVMPNPATDYLQLSCQLPTGISNPQLVLYNTVGQVVLQQAVPTTGGATVAIADLPAGVYVYALTDAQYRLLGKGKVVLK